MLERVIAYIERHLLLPARGEVVVAVSGGADSLCLLHLLLQICGPSKRYPDVTLHAAHLNHMLRGAESEHDAQVVAELMEAWQIPCTLGAIDVIALAQREKRSLEDAARVARYRFLREVAQGRPIAVAHHADDQVETILLHWLRGSGLSGLVGMPPRQQDIIRPLLEITRAETVAYCQAHAITPVEDHSNNDLRFLRNRLRHEVLPLLQEINPGLSRTLLRSAEVARVDLDWLEEQVDNCWASVVNTEQATSIQLNLPTLLALPLSLQRHLLRRVTARLCAGQSPLEPRHLLLLEQWLKERTGRQENELHLPQKLRAIYRANTLLLEHQRSARASLTSERAGETVLLPIPGTVQVPGTPWQAQAEVVPEQRMFKVREALQQEDWAQVWRMLEPIDRYSVYLDATSLSTPLLVRTRRPGDRMQPLGMPGEKKVQDIFVDKHVPRSERAMLPLFFSEAHCLWAAGACLDHRARLSRQTQRIVRLSIRPTTKGLPADQCDIMVP